MLKISSKISVTIFAAIFISLSVWGFFIFRGRDTQPSENIVEESQEQTQNEVRNEEELIEEKESKDEVMPPGSDEISNKDSAKDLPDNKDSEIEKTNLLEISHADCDNDCKDYDDSEEFRYCQEVCGLNSKKDDDANNKDCGNLSGLKKDYCLKDLAINERNLEMCEKIEDSGILKVCRNRITEDILDLQQEQE